MFLDFCFFLLSNYNTFFFNFFVALFKNSHITEVGCFFLFFVSLKLYAFQIYQKSEGFEEIWSYFSFSNR